MRSPMTAARTRWAAITAAALSAVIFLHICPGAGWFSRKHGTASA